MMYCKKIFVLFVLFMFLVSAQDYNKTSDTGDIWYGTGTETGQTPWVIYGIAAVMICFMFLAIVATIAYTFNMFQLKIWVRGELIQAGISAILVVLFIFFLQGAMEYVTVEYLGGGIVRCGTELMNASEPIKFAECKTNEKINMLGEMYETVYENNFGNERYMSQCYSAMGIPVWCGSWGGHIRKEVGKAHLLETRIIPLFIILWGHKVALGYIASSMLVLFLPLGILFRVLPFTRGIGGFFIAMAIGLYFVYPILLVLLDPSYMRPDIPFPSIYGAGDAEACYVGFSGAVAMSTDMMNRHSGGLGAISYDMIAEQITYLTVEALLYPFIAFALTVLFVRTISPMLGGEGAQFMRIAGRV